jgi:hypothetical protein
VFFKLGRSGRVTKVERRPPNNEDAGVANSVPHTVDWGALADALAPFEDDGSTPEEREAALLQARAIAGDDRRANALIDSVMSFRA